MSMANEYGSSSSPVTTQACCVPSADRTVLMTGGTGFLGLHLLRGFLAEGCKVKLLAHAGGLPALVRVRRFLESAGDFKLVSVLQQRLTIHNVDINLPTLGLSVGERDAITQDVNEMWHVAATVILDGRAAHVWQTNVTGTENVLRLYAQAPPGAYYRHVSTAFVAGNDRHRDVDEESSHAVRAFENDYERSKHAAEDLVRRWAEETGRTALLLRPSILVPGMFSHDGLPEHTMHTVGQIVSRIVEHAGQGVLRLVLRLGADPRAHLNLVQVDWAADAMRLLSKRLTTGIEAVHVVHDADVPVRSLAAALEDITAVRMRMMPALPGEPSSDERLFYRRIRGFLPYCYHRRSFATTKLRHLLPELSVPPTIERHDLARWMRDSVQTKTLIPSAEAA